MTDRSNVARVGALALGVGYVLAGVAGFFVTGFIGFVADTDETLIGFDLNIFHNVVHLAIGGALIVVSRIHDVAITQGVLIGVGLFYVAGALLGFLDALPILSISDELAPDNFLHLFSGLAALIFGLIGVRQHHKSLQRQPAY